MPKIELSEVEASYVRLLHEVKERAIAEAQDRCNEGLRKLLRGHGHPWPPAGCEMQLRDVKDKTILEWKDKEKNDGPDHADPSPAGRAEGSP